MSTCLHHVMAYFIQARHRVAYQRCLSSHRNVMNVHYTESIKNTNTYQAAAAHSLIFVFPPCTSVDLHASPPLHLFHLGLNQKMHIYKRVCTKVTNSELSELLINMDNATEACNWYGLSGLCSSWGAGTNLCSLGCLQNNLSLLEAVSLLNVF